MPPLASFYEDGKQTAAVLCERKNLLQERTRTREHVVYSVRASIMMCIIEEGSLTFQEYSKLYFPIPEDDATGRDRVSDYADASSNRSTFAQRSYSPLVLSSGSNMTKDWRTIFVTGGAGYIGSHCIVELLESGYDVIAIDNFANSVTEGSGESAALKRVEQITGKKVTFYNCDLIDRGMLEVVFNKHKIDCVVHFAAIKAVGESMQVPLHYYRNNIIGAINLLEVMKAAGCFQLVFSSSCTVYGEPEELPITEKHPTGNITNVYGRTKYFIEEMLKDISRAEKNWNIISLRYFNPVGAHPSGLIGEDPTKPFTNLMPYIAQVALRHKSELVIFGGDYSTKDGTGVRDYIHVMDLAAGHVAALNALHKQHSRLRIYNLGTGKGVSVLELIKTFERVTATTVPYIIKDRREGDIVSMYANTDLAEKELNWRTKYNVEQMCEDFWRWQTMNPHGYRTSIKNGINEHVNGTV